MTDQEDNHLTDFAILLNRLNRQMTLFTMIIVAVIAIIGTWIIYTNQSIEQRQIERARINDEAFENMEDEHERLLFNQQQIRDLITILNRTN
jgi:hypothetical protein